MSTAPGSRRATGGRKLAGGADGPIEARAATEQRRQFPQAGELITARDKEGAVAIGMVVDILTKDPDWMDQLTEVSTRDAEKQTVFA
jgi:hypothetical protein